MFFYGFENPFKIRLLDWLTVLFIIQSFLQYRATEANIYILVNIANTRLSYKNYLHLKQNIYNTFRIQEIRCTKASTIQAIPIRYVFCGRLQVFSALYVHSRIKYQGFLLLIQIDTCSYIRHVKALVIFIIIATFLLFVQLLYGTRYVLIQ